MKVRTEARREAILEIASQVFMEYGFERASMAEIVRRIGGSKSTIYGYYPSKEALFQAVTQAAGEHHVRPAFDELAAHDIATGIYDMLGRFAESLAVFMCSDQLIAIQRMVLAEAGHSTTGELFYEAGPKRGAMDLAAFFDRLMEQGGMRKADPLVAAQQFIGLMQAEIQSRWYYRNPLPVKKAEIRARAQRAVDTFARAYELQRHTPQDAPKSTDLSNQTQESSQVRQRQAKSGRNGCQGCPA